MNRLVMLELLRELHNDAEARCRKMGGTWPCHEHAMSGALSVALDAERMLRKDDVQVGKLFRDAHKTSGELIEQA